MHLLINITEPALGEYHFLM